MKHSLGDLVYQGERAGVHNWNTLAGTSFYWHPDWLHIAEDMTGMRPAATIDTDNPKPTQQDAEQTILKHLDKQP